MALHNTETSYGSVNKVFHWLMALMIAGLLAVGLWMTGLESGPTKFQVYAVHKATGMVVLMLAVARVLWRLRQVMPKLPDAMPVWQKKAAEYAHAALYFVMLAMPLSGWAMSNAAGYPVSVFGFFTMPEIVGADPELRKIFGEVHEICGALAIGLIALHVGAAMQHHFFKKDDILRRMLPTFGGR